MHKPPHQKPILLKTGHKTLSLQHLDTHAANTHAPAPYITAQNGPWHQSLVGIGSEWSVQFPGYVAGAVDAANIGVELYLKNVKA
ncbi:hypothetical protein ACOBV8_18375 (plasmid) [Pseudoalteromonas espejiana]